MPPNNSLSICIATFNRARFIGQTLDALLPQLVPGTEVVILDGGSTDDTEQVVRRYQDSDSRLKYFRQATNNGVDRDFDRAVQLASGQYCWLMSDDDLILPGGLAHVMSRLPEQRSLLIVNAEVKTHDFSALLEDRRLKFDADRFYSPAELDGLFVDTGLYMTFIGCIVIDRALWLSRDRESFFGSQFIHMGVIFQSPLPHGAVVIAHPYISIRYGNASWKSKEFEIWLYRWPTLVWSLAGLSSAAKQKVCPQACWLKAKTLALYRAKGAYSPEDFRSWVRPRASWLASLIPRIIAQIPGRVLNSVAIAYFSNKMPAAAMTLQDLQNSRYRHNK